MATKKKKDIDPGKNVRIPTKEFQVIKKFADDNNLKIGGFVTQVVIREIESQKVK
jgi:hypothetical protein